jgi:HSP20 family protein
MTAMRRLGAWPALPSWPEERIDRMFRDMFRDFFAGRVMLDRYVEAATHAMHIEEFIEDGTCVIRAELPGIDPDKGIEITVSDGVLHLSAKREEREEEERPSGYRSEFRYGSFERSIRLPEGATESDVKASYKDGILEVRIAVPKTEAPALTKVPIEH